MQQKYQMRRQKKKRQEGLKCNVQTQVRRVELRVFPP